MANVNLFDYINAKEIAAYVKENPINKEPYFAETLFPSRTSMGTDISWLKGANGLPVALQPSEYDVKARMREKEGFEAVATEMAFFREAMRIGEKDRQQLNLLLAHPDNTVALPLIRKIFDEAARLIEGARVQAEIMRCQLMVDGKIDVASADGRAHYVYDYGMTNLYKAVRAAWVPASKATADPVRDLIDICDDMELKTGIRPSRAVMNRNTFLNMINCDTVQKMMYPDDSTMHYFVSEQQKKSFIEQVTGVSIYVYSKKFGKLDHTTGLAHATEQVTLIPDNKVVLMPSGNLGNTVYGTTPEASDLMSGTDAQVAQASYGTTVTTFKEKHPVQVVTVVSCVMIPSFEAIDNCAVIDVSDKAEIGA